MNDQLLQKIQQARDAGIPEEQIRQRVQQQFGVDISQAATPPREGIISSVAKTLTRPFVESAKTIGGGIYETGRALAGSFAKTPEQQASLYWDPKTGRKIENPFLSTQQLTEAGTKPGKFLWQRGIQPGAGVASWAIPVGKGATFASKFVTPGAAIGALQATSFTEKEKLEDIAVDIAGGAIKGAAFSAAIGALSTALGKLGGRLQKSGGQVRQGVRQIYEPGSIYGAEKEKIINAALDKLGIKGNPQSQYEQLLPATRKLSGSIDDYLSAKPDVYFDTMEIKSAMLNEIKNGGQIRTGVMTSREAEQAVKEYMTQIMYSKSAVSSFGDKISGRDLLNIKLNVMNPDISSAYDAVARGQALSTTQKILKNIRDSVDHLLSAKYPEVKEATVLQSLLHDAADSLNKARKTVPTFRVFGVTVPQPIKASLQDFLGAGLQRLGVGSEGLSLPGVAPTIAGMGSRLLSTPQQPDQYPQTEGAQGQQQTNYNQGGGQFNQGDSSVSQEAIIGSRRSAVQGLMSQGITDPAEMKSLFDEQNRAQGHKDSDFTLDEIKGYMNQVPETPTEFDDMGEKRMRLAYMMYLYPKQASTLKSMFQTLYPASSSVTQGKIQDAASGLGLMNTLKQKYEEVQGAGLTASGPGFGLLRGGLGTVASLTQYSPEATAYANTKTAFMSRLARAAGEKGVLTDYDIARIEKAIPTFYTSPAAAEQQWQLIADVIGSAIRTGGTKAYQAEEVPTYPSETMFEYPY